jgi:DNA topoisomerase I
VAARLGNTPSVCRKCYVHPAVLDTYFSGAMIKTVKKHVEEDAPHALRQEEVALLHLLQKRLALAAA